jgi:type VI secretion system protein ImpA
MAIEVDEYLKDIDGKTICGDDLQYDAEFLCLEQDIKGKPEQVIGDTVIEAEPPNWRDIKKQTEALLSRSIDLRILIYHLRALIALQGFSGLEDGLQLLHAAIEQRWDSLYPQLDPDDDNDPTERINILSALCDYDIFLKPLQQIPLLNTKAVGKFNSRDINIASGKFTVPNNEKSINQATIEAAIQDSDVENLQQTLHTLTASLDYLNQLESKVTDYVGTSNASSFAELRSFLKESQAFLTTTLNKKGVDSNSSVQAGEDIQDHTVAPVFVMSSTQAAIAGTINNTQDVIRVLNLVCEYYQKNEPSSPVPMLIARAMRLVGKSFMEALKDIAPAGVDEATTIFGRLEEESNDY